ncbi:MAG: hemerythrin domain-containing protein [Bryobacter sp.]|jgi:hemerythrin|nr:hemerythrin domain-containing protein [Bryobacter sp.]
MQEEFRNAQALMQEQHEHQMLLLGKLEVGLFAPYQGVRLEAILDELIAFTRRHFAEEYALMRAAGYPWAARHSAQHEIAVRKLNRLQRAIASGQSRFSVALVRQIRDWILLHISREDEQFQAYLKKRAA